MSSPSPRFLRNLASNIVDLRLRPDRALRPLFASYHVTWRCNLRCTYCRFPVTDHHRDDELDTDGARALIRRIAEGVGALGFTGGEPLMRPDLPELAAEARRAGLSPVILTTNGLLLPRRPAVLQWVDVVQISVDGLPGDDGECPGGMSERALRRLLAAVRWAGEARSRYGFKLVLNAVLGGQPPEVAARVEGLAREVGASFTAVRQVGEDGPRIHPEHEEGYRGLYRRFRQRRLRGDTILGSSPAALRIYEELGDFGCLPELNLRVLPDGRLPLPCHELPHTPVDLTAVDSWSEVRQALDRHRLSGPCPTCCYAPCHLEPTLMVRRPWNALWVAQTGRARRGAGPVLAPPQPAT
jgi:MoaA/NifB/PqqE/SkfB family radical SAM enzyme